MSETTTLAQCPIGLFLHEGELCLKTEYGDNQGRIDAYIVSTGEFFWGHSPQTIANQREQIVTPVEWPIVSDDWRLGAEAMRTAIVENIQGWVDSIVKNSNGEVSLIACAYAGAREVARCTLRPTKGAES